MSVQTSISELPSSRVKIVATVQPEEVDSKVDRAAAAIGREMKMPGFRKGKVPAQIVIGQVGRAAVLEQALRDSLPEWYEQAIIESGVTPVGEPELDFDQAPDPSEPLEFTIEIGVRPTAKLGDYKGLEVGKAEPELPEGAIEREIDQVRESSAALNPVERAAVEGDHLLIDFTGSIAGEEFEGGAATDFLLELGSDTLIDDFDEQLVGAEAGEERKVEVSFPDDYHADHLAAEDAAFDVVVKEVREKQLPELDDDFAADNTDFDTLEEWRADIEHRLSHAAEHRIDDQFRGDAVDAVVDAATVEVPEAITLARAEELWERIERQLQGSGMDPEAYLGMQGKTREEAVAEASEDAEQSIRREAVLAAVAEAEGIEVSEEELLEALQPPAGEKGKPEKLLKRLRKEGRDKLLVEDLKMRHAADWIVEQTTPIEMDRAEARQKLWTPEELEQAGEPSELWTPEGADQPAPEAEAEPGAEQRGTEAGDDQPEADGEPDQADAEAEAAGEEH